ncbi:Histone-lysine N-methyltransferase smyd1 [Entophlyctis luteolus]|nr:Histone-lysine N-methyltransferase smyd1 [Entophlyctis luteolus]
MRVQPVPGKGNGIVCAGPAPVRAETLLLRERVFEHWPAGSYAAAAIAARLFFRTRRYPLDALSAASLFPATASDVPAPRREQVASVVLDALCTAAAAQDPAYAINESTDIEIALRLYFVVECNSFPTGLLITLSNANHSCNPNCYVLEEDPVDGEVLPTYTLTAKRDISPGEEITISYLDLVSMVELAEDRRRHLEEHFLFFCMCEWCHSPLEKVGLLAASSEESHFGPKFEDLACHAFSWPPDEATGQSQKCVDGRIGCRTGLCDGCQRVASQKQLDTVQQKADRLIVNLRRFLLETNSFLAQIRKNNFFELERPSSSSSSKSTKTASSAASAGNERIKYISTIKELKRLLKVLEGMKTRSQELLHSTHIAFGPIEACLAKLRSGLVEVGEKSRQSSN